MTDWLKQYKWHAAGGVALVLIISAAFMLLSGKRETSSGLSIPEEASAQTYDKKEEVKREKSAGKEAVIIDLKGAVKNPGVYQMKEGDRVHDVLKKAGGTEKKRIKSKLTLQPFCRTVWWFTFHLRGKRLLILSRKRVQGQMALPSISSISIRLPLRSFRRFPASALQKRKRLSNTARRTDRFTR